MSLLTALRAGVKVADKVTKPLQATVFFEHCIGSDPYGPLYAAPVSLRAIVDMKDQQVRTRGGILAASKGQITLLDVAAIVAATGTDGRVLDIDLFTVPGWPASAIVAIGGFIDAGTGYPVATDVWI